MNHEKDLVFPKNLYFPILGLSWFIIRCCKDDVEYLFHYEVIHISVYIHILKSYIWFMYIFHLYFPSPGPLPSGCSHWITGGRDANIYIYKLRWWLRFHPCKQQHWFILVRSIICFPDNILHQMNIMRKRSTTKVATDHIANING